MKKLLRFFLFVVLLFVFLFLPNLQIFAQSASVSYFTIVGNPSNNGFSQGIDSSTTCPNPNPPNAEQQLNLWGFTISGVEKSPQMVEETYNTICILYQSAIFKNILGADTSPIDINFADITGRGGYMHDINHIEMDRFGESSNIYYHRFVLMHELAHVIAAKQEGGQVFDGFISLGTTGIQSALGQQSSLNCPVGHDNPPPYSDCFADMVASYIVGNKYEKSIGDFSTNSSLLPYYTLIKNDIFGGVTFSASGQGIANYAIALEKSISKACPGLPGQGLVTAQNNFCLDKLDINPPASVINELKSSSLVYNPEGQQVLQCVGFAEAVSLGIGATIGDHNASDYKDISIPGYTWVPYGPGFNFQIGDFLIQGKHGVNHIAIITGVNLAAGTVSVAEASGSNGHVYLDPVHSIQEIENSLLGFQRKN